VSLDLLALTAGRSTHRVLIHGDRFEPTAPAPPPSAWMVNGNRARPAFGPEPARFGPGPALPRTQGPEQNGHATGDLRSVSRNGHAHHVPPSNGPVPDARSRAVFAAFQQTMQTFLDVQQQT